MDDSVIELSSLCSTASRHTVTNEESSSERSEVNQADRACGNKAGRQSPVPAESSSSASVVDLNSRVQDDAFSSSSSSSSSGVPGQQIEMWPIGTQKKKSGDGGGMMGPPEVIKFDLNNSSPSNSPVCQRNKMGSSNNQPARKKSLTNESKTITDENSSCTGTSTLDSRANASQQKITTKAKPRRKKRQWGRKKTADDSHMSTTDGDGPKNKVSSDQESKHYHCYLLRSLDPGHPLKTYIGFTTNPERRLRQHNGDLKNGGARRTKRAGRPWTFVCVVHGFQDKINALQFEWAWQNVHKSKTFREAVGDDELCKKMKRRYGPKARLDELRILLTECLPFSLYNLTVYFPEQKYHDVFGLILRRGSDGNPYKKAEPGRFEDLTSIEVRSVDQMPHAMDVTAARDRKKLAREAKKKETRKNKSDKGSSDKTDISAWIENAEANVGNDFLLDFESDGEIDGTEMEGADDEKPISDDDNESLCSDAGDDRARLMAVDLVDSGSSGDELEDVSHAFLSMRVDSRSKEEHNLDVALDDSSTISSEENEGESRCISLGSRGREPNRLWDKENQANRRSRPDCEIVDLT
mmetsp:Transcript_31512/g.71297  ORF Transcript_31512/g.71297 Transcript_31512/m.71297 type:complete len:581 (+) Transcript_31512:123-1865(+)